MIKNVKKLSLGFLAVALISIPSASAFASSTPHVTFSTNVSIDVVPDKDTVTLNISGEGSSSQSAKTVFSDSERSFNNIILEQKIAKKSITTTSINSYSSTDANNNEKFYFNKSASVVFLDISKAELFLDAISATEGITISSNVLSVSNNAKYEKLLLEKATAKAKARATSYAKNLGFKRARVIKIEEGYVNNFPGPIYTAAKGSDTSPTIDPGVSQISLTLTSTWGLYN